MAAPPSSLGRAAPSATPGSSLQVLGLVALAFLSLVQSGENLSVWFWAGENARPGVNEGLQQGCGSLAGVVCRHTSVMTPGLGEPALEHHRPSLRADEMGLPSGTSPHGQRWREGGVVVSHCREGSLSLSLLLH